MPFISAIYNAFIHDNSQFGNFNISTVTYCSSKFAITRNADQGHGIPLGLPDKQSSVGMVQFSSTAPCNVVLHMKELKERCLL